MFYRFACLPAGRLVLDVQFEQLEQVPAEAER
jgi:hypothetical protein